MKWYFVFNISSFMYLDYVKVRRKKEALILMLNIERIKIFFLAFGRRGKNYATADNQF